MLEQNMTMDSEINQKDKSNSNEKMFVAAPQNKQFESESLDFIVPFGHSGCSHLLED